jgi:hypothetical protein
MKDKNFKPKNSKSKELERIDISRKKKANKPNRKKEFEF